MDEEVEWEEKEVVAERGEVEEEVVVAEHGEEEEEEGDPARLQIGGRTLPDLKECADGSWSSAEDCPPN